MTHSKATDNRCTMGKLVASRKSITSSTGSSWTTLDSDKSKTKGRACVSKNFSGENLNTRIQMLDKFKPAGRDQWDKLAVQLCVRGRELDLGWKLRDGKQVPDIVLEAKRVKEVCEALVDNSPDSAVPEGVNENLEEELGPELDVLSSKQQNPPPLLYTPKTKRSKVENVSNLFSSAVESIHKS